MKKITKAKILRLVIIVCLAVFLVWNIYLLNEKTLRGNALPMPFGFGAAMVLSGSMEPTIQVDDMIFVVQRDAYGVGDVVVYQSGDSLVVHRIIAMENGVVTTQGDANNAPDEPVEYGTIKGAMVGRIAGVGNLVRTVKSPIVSFSLMGLAIYLLERSFRKEKQDDTDEIRKMEEEIRRLKNQTES